MIMFLIIVFNRNIIEKDDAGMSLPAEIEFQLLRNEAFDEALVRGCRFLVSRHVRKNWDHKYGDLSLGDWIAYEGSMEDYCANEIDKMDVYASGAVVDLGTGNVYIIYLAYICVTKCIHSI